MTLYIRKSVSPDIVERFDNVIELIVDRENQIIYMAIKEPDRIFHINMNCVISVESN